MLGNRFGWLVVPAVLLGGLGLALAALYALHHWTREAVQTEGAGSVAFLDMDCPPPPGRTRADFLREVRYESGLPAHVSRFEPGLADRLAAAFQKHPYVARVEHIEIGVRQIHVQLSYRAPVLVITPADKAGHAFQVDAQGVHLGPVSDPALPVYRLRAEGAADERAIRAAARTIGFLRPDQAVLRLQAIEGPADRLILHRAGSGEVIWGHAPGEEEMGEPPAERKRVRLLEHCKTGAARSTLDLRSGGKT